MAEDVCRHCGKPKHSKWHITVNWWCSETNGATSFESIPSGEVAQGEPKKYLDWQHAGGPNECAHGYAAGIPCPRCDEEKQAAQPEPQPAGTEPRWNIQMQNQNHRVFFGTDHRFDIRFPEGGFWRNPTQEDDALVEKICSALNAESELAALKQSHTDEVEKLKAEITQCRAANELDRRSLFAVVNAIDAEITGRLWLIEGRGAYEWDDDKYRQEFGWAVHAMQEKLEPLRKIASDLRNCPETEDGVNSVRKLERENSQLKQNHTQCVEALTRAERKLRAYVGVCKGDKELTNTILPMCEAALDTARKLVSK